MHCLWNGFLHSLPSVRQPGQQPICPATAALLRAESTFRITPPPATSDYALATLLGKQDCNDLQKALQRQTQGHAVPPWAAPREAWRSLLQLKSPSRPNLLRKALERQCILIRRLDRVPVPWATTWGCPVPKNNGKPGCLAWRLTQIAEIISSSWAAMMWRRMRHGSRVSNMVLRPNAFACMPCF